MNALGDVYGKLARRPWSENLGRKLTLICGLFHTVPMKFPMISSQSCFKGVLLISMVVNMIGAAPGIGDGVILRHNTNTNSSNRPAFFFFVESTNPSRILYVDDNGSNTSSTRFASRRDPRGKGGASSESCSS